MSIQQQTLKDVAEISGIGAHTGQNVKLTLRPAPCDTGIIFRRTDLFIPIDIPAHVAYVGDTYLSTCLVKDNVRITMVEHLLSALAGLSIDNAFIELTASELPIIDGSAAPYQAAYQCF
jgi:UDP-3-O-[3-hydroxymyristoyl] N-acetylglucosamine deacetylase